MTFSGWLTIFLFVVILSALATALGSYMAKVYGGERVFLTPLVGWLETPLKVPGSITEAVLGKEQRAKLATAKV